MLKWQRVKEWRTVLRLESKKSSRWELAKNIWRTIKTGPVPRSVWRTRMRTCPKCPIFDGEHKRCRCLLPGMQHLGCGCYTPFVALTANPYGDGCWGHSRNTELGWPAYHPTGRLRRVRAILSFLLGR